VPEPEAGADTDGDYTERSGVEYDYSEAETEIDDEEWIEQPPRPSKGAAERGICRSRTDEKKKDDCVIM
jgi:hypothetical protein